jgi:predicted nucleic acid binding AN1-type Zn finger protein
MSTTTSSMPATQLPATTTTTKRSRCKICSKKLTLCDFQCGKCKVYFCGSHRLPEQHACDHDFQTEGKALLAEQLQKVTREKLDKI